MTGTSPIWRRFTGANDQLIIKPFRPVLFRKELDNVTSPPFDTITKPQETVLKQNPYNITHLTLPDSGDGAISRKILDKWMDEGVLVREDRESIVVITQDFRGNGKEFCRIGIIVPVETSPPQGIILPHEQTFDWAVNERKDVMLKSGCQLEPIFLAINGVSFERILRAAVKNLAPARTFEEPSGVINKFFIISEKSTVESVARSLRKDKAIVADGHHRLRATTELYAENGNERGEFWKYSLAYVTSLQQESLMISGIHRLMAREFKFSMFRDRIEEYFEINSVSQNEGLSLITIYDKGQYFSLAPRENAFDMIGEYGKYRLKTDPSLVNTLIFENIMGLKIDEVARKVGYTHSVPFAVEEVDKGNYGFAILMPQWDKSTFLSMTEKGRVMPQKSTYFYPKIPSGIALYC